jgi:hypothetical protein
MLTIQYRVEMAGNQLVRRGYRHRAPTYLRTSTRLETVAALRAACSVPAWVEYAIAGLAPTDLVLVQQVSRWNLIIDVQPVNR